MTQEETAVIGAGVAGLACARRLVGAGAPVRVFDKGRSVGGRLATRRVETADGLAQFDHGAQFFTARDPAFQAALAAAPQATSSRWQGQGVGDDWRVAAPGMSGLAKALAESLPVITGVRVQSISRETGAWVLTDETGGRLGRFRRVVLAVPAEQAAPLLAPIAPAFAEEAAAAVTAPCWAGLFAFAEAPAAAAAVYEPKAPSPLSWIACDSAKPQRPAGLSCWVAHASPAWTRAHLEEDAAAVAPLLLAAMQAHLGPLPPPVLIQAHRWRFAKVERAAGSPFAWDGARGFGVCGDWRLGPRVELAWRSGHELAGAILGQGA